VAHVLVDSVCYAQAHNICHLHGAISDTLGKDQYRVSNVLAFITALGLTTVI
jgi:hypothetical protein